MKTCPHCGSSHGTRSSPDHRRLMGIIAAAYDQWPERKGLFQPMSAEHLRAWLICKAGPDFRTVATFDMTGFTPEQRALTAKAVAGERAIVGQQDQWLYKIEPKSMKFEKMKQAEFSRLRDAICEVIEAEIGVPAERLLKERERAA